MKKIFYILCLSLLSTSNIALAHTQGQFVLGGRVVITISEFAPDGTPDTDAFKLYELMNVPPQNSFLGPGKSITTANRDLSFVCGTKAHNGGPACTVILDSSARLKNSPTQKKASYLLQGDEAQVIASKWNLTDSKLEFTSVDNKLRLLVSESGFQVDFSDSGINDQ